MIRYRVRELISDWSFSKGRTLSITELAEQAGITRRVLNSMANEKGYNATVANIDRLCRFFNCEVSAVITYVPDEHAEAGQNKQKGRKTRPKKPSTPEK